MDENFNVSRLTTPSGMIMSIIDASHFFDGLVLCAMYINCLFKGRWIIDSGASTHVAHFLSCFQSYIYVTD